MDTAPDALAGRPRSKHWTRVSRGLYRSDGASDLSAWQLALPPSGRFTHLTAAAALGWWVPHPPNGTAGCRRRRRKQHSAPGAPGTAAPACRPSRTTAHPRPAPGRTPPRTCYWHVPETSRSSTWWSWSTGHFTAATWVSTGCSRPPRARRRGNRTLRSALALADSRSESPWESVLRLLHHTLDAPVEPQREIWTPDSELVARADLWLIGTTSIHEYDGEVHLERSQQQADLRRARRWTDAGWTRRGYTSFDLLRQPIGVLRDVDTALGRAHEPGRVRPWYLMLRVLNGHRKRAAAGGGPDAAATNCGFATRCDG